MMISYIVPTLNSEKTIEKCIYSILAQENDKEIIIIDNGSIDNTLGIITRLAKKYPEIKVLKEKKRGAAAARNRGLEVAKGNYIAFIDSDVILPKGWAKKAIKKLESDGTIAGVGGTAKNTSEGIIAELFDPLFLYYLDKAEIYVNSLATMNVMFKRDIIKNERFDENLVTSEDPEFSFRLRKRGYNLLLSRELEVMHHHPTKFRDIIRRWFYYGKNYHIPYFRYPENISLLFVFKIIYLPILIISSIYTYFNIKMLFLPILMVLIVFGIYTYIGLKNIEKLKWKMLLFPFLHLFKFHIHCIGLLYGLIYHGIKKSFSLKIK